MSNIKDDRAKAARNAYARQWRAKNPDKVKAAQARYWDRIAERMEGNNPSDEKEVKACETE